MKTLLVATDLSIVAANAVKYAADLAVSMNAQLHILHVYQVPIFYFEVGVMVTEDDLKQDVTSEMTRIKEELTVKTEGKLQIDLEIRKGDFLHELQLVCDKVKPFTVIIGSREKPPLSDSYLVVML